MNANFASKKPFRLKEKYELIEFGIFLKKGLSFIKE